jgi:hypothetical protein
MKPVLLLVACHLPFILCCQGDVEGRWKMESGLSTSSRFNTYFSYNLRTVSPRFKWSNRDLSEEEEKHPEKFRKARFMFELIYKPPLNVFGMSCNVQYRLLKYKKLSLEAYAGLKFFIVPSPDFVIKSYYSPTINKGVWYINEGLILQFNLGVIAPFADIGYDGIFTLGAEFDFHKIYKNPKRRYKLHARPVSD